MKLRNKWWILLTVLVVSCCTPASNQDDGTPREYYESGRLEIIKVRDCEYVLWYNGYGSNMEHYEGCQNPNHN